MLSGFSANSLSQCAAQYLQQGFSIVIVSKDKHPIHSWRQFQSAPMTMQFLQSITINEGHHGVAIIGGMVSKNFVAFDIDCKNDLSGTIMNELLKSIRMKSHSLLSKLVIASTPSHGFHFYFLTEHEISSRIVAKNIQSDCGYSVLIELRSKFQYSIVPPSTGYSFIQGNLTKLPVLNTEELDVLLSAGASCNRSDYVRFQPPIQYRKRQIIIGSPLDDYDHRGEVVGLLLTHGWKICPQHSDNIRIYFQRPGNTKHKTSANFHKLHNTFIVHSASTQFLPGVPYKPSSIFAELECSGDYKLAAKKLIQLGFGTSYSHQRYGR